MLMQDLLEKFSHLYLDLLEGDNSRLCNLE